MTQANFKAAVLVSGGMDSYIGYHICCHRYGEENVIPLYVRINQPYMEREDLAVKLLYEGKAPNFKIINADLCNILPGVVDRTNPIIPARNLLLCYYGALFSENVFLSSLNTDIYRPASELMPDNQAAGHAMIGHTLSTLMMKPVNILSSIDQFSKGSMLYFALTELGIRPSEIAQTLTCYEADANMGDKAGSVTGCGRCSACTRRAVAWQYAISKALWDGHHRIVEAINDLYPSQFIVDPLAEQLYKKPITELLAANPDEVRNPWYLRTLQEMCRILRSEYPTQEMRWFTISGMEEWLTVNPRPSAESDIVDDYLSRCSELIGRKDHPVNIRDDFHSVVIDYPGSTYRERHEQTTAGKSDREDIDG